MTQDLIDKDPLQLESAEEASALYLLGMVHSYEESYTLAETELQKSLEIYRDLADKAPEDYKEEVAKVLNGMAISYISQKQYVKAESLFKESVQIYEELARESPASYAEDIAALRSNLAHLYSDTKRYSLAEQEYKKWLDVYIKWPCGDLDKPENYAFAMEILEEFAEIQNTNIMNSKEQVE